MTVVFQTQNIDTIQNVQHFIEDFLGKNECIIAHTSGSTGVPKEISLLKSHVISSARKTIAFLGIQKGQTALLCLNPDTIAGKMMIVRALVAKLRLIVVDATSNPLETINEHIEFAAMVPLQIEKSLIKQSEKLERISKLIVGGAPVSAKLYRELIHHKNSIYQTFGMTETISHVALRKLNSTQIEPYSALSGVYFTENRNCLVIHAPEIGVVYLKTNDIIELIDDQHFKWLGRKDFVINSGGVKIHPEQVESALAEIVEYPFFVAGMEDESLGEKVVLFIESTSENLPDKIVLSKVLNRFQMPKEILSFESFIYTNSHKINRPETIKQCGNAIRTIL